MTTLAPGWELMPVPAGVPGLVAVRTRLPESIRVASTAAGLEAVALDVSAGLADHFADVLLVDAGRDAGAIELLHAAAGGIVIRTRLDRTGAARCWLWPTASFVDSTPVRIAEARLTTGGAEFSIRRRGPLAQVAQVGTAEALDARDLPAWLFRAGGLGPRPSGATGLDILPRAELPPVTWSLAWCTGTDDRQEPSNEDWSTAVMTGSGSLDLIDTGTQLRRVLPELPDALATDARDALPGTGPAALVPISAGEVFALLTTLTA